MRRPRTGGRIADATTTTPQPQTLARLRPQHGTDHGQQIRTTAGRDPGDGVAGLLVDIRQPFQHRFKTCGGGRDETAADTHIIVKFPL